MIQTFEIRDFTGGLNTISSLERLQNNELTDITNLDISETGKALIRRYGFERYYVPETIGKGQGFFRYYTELGYKEIVAVGGNFEVDGQIAGIENLPEGFQSFYPIQGVQYENKMYFATGTKLVEYDGEHFKVVEPYKPNPLEALYIGTNALADNPNQFMTDGEALSIRIDGVTFSTRYGYINNPVTLTAYVSKPSDKNLEYLFEWRTPFMEDGFWELGQDWNASKTWNYTPNVEGDIQFRVSTRETGLTVAEAQYLVPKFKVKATKTPGDEYKDVSLIHQCTRIFVHWGRLYLYGDPNNPQTLFYSDLEKPSYFPMTNNIDLENHEEEGITTVLKYRDMLIGFTPDSIQAIYGKGPSDMKRVTLNTDIGCIAPESAQVLDNIIVFLSNKGVYYLESVGYTEEKGNVTALDTKIKNLIVKDKEAKAIVFNNQYQLLFSNNKRMKFYQTHGCWTKDESAKFTFERFYVFENELYAQNKADGTVMRFDPNVFTDDGEPYDDSFETPYYTFGEPYTNKKMKLVELVVSPKLGKINLKTYIYSDNAQLTTMDKGHAQINEQGEIEWVVQSGPNLSTKSSTTLGEWILGESQFGFTDYEILKLRVSGKFKRTKLKVSHSENSPNVILGFNCRFVTSQSDRS